MKTIINYSLITIIAIALAAPAGKSSEINHKVTIGEIIKKVQPGLKAREVEKLSNAFMNMAQNTNPEIPWEVVLSVAFTESSLIKNKIGKMNPKTKDYGLMQINEKMIKSLHLSKQKLLRDEEYNLMAGYSILAQNKHMFAHKYPYWIGIYRSGTALWKLNTRKVARAYDKKIRGKAAEINKVAQILSNAPTIIAQAN